MSITYLPCNDFPLVILFISFNVQLFLIPENVPECGKVPPKGTFVTSIQNAEASWSVMRSARVESVQKPRGSAAAAGSDRKLDVILNLCELGKDLKFVRER